MPNPFHSSFFVADLGSMEDKGVVDGVAVPMPHFGAILGRDESHALAARIRAAGLGFVIEPRFRFAGRSRRAGDDVPPRSQRKRARVQGGPPA
jgi:extradiol dioxygenase family protein